MSSEGRPGDLFEGACRDTRTAWENTSIRRRIPTERIEQLKGILATGDAPAVARLLGEMANNPYASAAFSMGFDDGKANRLGTLLMTAFLQPFVSRRPSGRPLDLSAVKDTLRKWIDDASLPLGEGEGSDIGKISRLIEHPEQRVFLAAAYAAPIQFLLLINEH